MKLRLYIFIRTFLNSINISSHYFDKSTNILFVFNLTAKFY